MCKHKPFFISFLFFVIFLIYKTGCCSTLDTIQNASLPDSSQQKHDSLSPVSPLREAPTLNSRYIRYCLEDGLAFVSSPLRWKAHGWVGFGITTAITASLYTQDQKVKDRVQTHRTDAMDKFFAKETYLGDGKLILPLIAGGYVSGLILDNGKMQSTALLSLESIIISGVVVDVIKYSTHRNRPSSGNPYNVWEWFGFESENRSFPSGHSACIFSAMSVVSFIYRDKPIIVTTAYSIAALTAFSRIYNNAHWSSDAFLGSVIGWYTGAIVAKQWGFSSPVSIQPTIRENSYGANIIVPIRSRLTKSK